ncbi:MAG: hypothetical protein ACE5DU_05340 [Nitrosopumilus sp.]
MTKLKTTLTISAIASILIIGGFATATPNAFSTYDSHDDDCDYGYDHDDDCVEDTPNDPCDCEKPDTLKFKFSTPSAEIDSEFRIEIYKKLNDIGNHDKKLMGITDVTNLGDYQIESSSFGKDKLNSNTVFAIYKIVEDQDDVLVSSIEVHTSCSKPLYKGLTVMDSGYALEITDGLKNDETSISASDPLTCGDEPESAKMGSIRIKNALTSDNGGEAEFTDFTFQLIDVDTGIGIDLIQDLEDPSINEIEVPTGTYTLSQTIAEVTGTYTTVLITGDKKCPSMTEESFEIKKDKTISCTIYNDDDGNAGGDIEPGVIFHVGTVKFDNIQGSAVPRCDPVAVTLPCAFEDIDGLISIVPNLKENELLRVSTLVLISVVGLDVNDTTMQDQGSTTGCTFDGLNTFIDNSNVEYPAFKIQCSGLTSSSEQYRINYALIETLIPPNTL